MRRTCWLSPAMALVLAGPGVRAEPPDAAQVQAMAPIAWMAGEWRGKATMQRGPAESRMHSSELVLSAAGGTALLVRGQHHVIKADGSTGDLVHDAAAMITFDPRSGKFRFVTQLANGRSGTFDGTIENGRFRWELPAPGGRVRYEIWRNAAGQWEEVGEFCDASACQPFFKMLLDRQ